MAQYTGNPTADVEIISDNPTTNYDSAAHLDVGNFGAAGLRRSLMTFDTSSIPAGATITSATLRMTQFYQDIPAESTVVRLFKLLRAFTEAGATWNTYDGSNAWTTAGAFGAATDYDNTASATATTPADQTDGSLTTFASVPASLITVNGTTRLLVKQDTAEGVGFNRTSWYDRLAGTVANRPLLTVNYTSGGGGTAPTAAPSSVSAVAGRQSGLATVKATVVPAANNGGTTITAYTAISTPGGLTGTVTNASGFSDGDKVYVPVMGLTNNTAYTFTVHGTNSAGNSVESSASAAVTPTAAPTTWPGLAGGPQHTGSHPTSPGEPWALRYHINGPDSSGKVPAGPETDPPATYTVAGNSMLFQAFGSKGIVAYNDSDGTVAWRSPGGNGTVDAQTTPVYDATTNSLLVVGPDGRLVQLNASTGAVLGIAYCLGRVDVPPCLDEKGHVAVANEWGQLLRFTISALSSNVTPATPDWTYTAPGNVKSETVPAYDFGLDVWVYCTSDLYVHCVKNSNGAAQCAPQKPSGNTPNSPNNANKGNTFRGTMPVIASQHGFVFVEMIPEFNLMNSDVSSGEDTNAHIRTYLNANPSWQTLFCLSLTDLSQPLGVLPCLFCGEESQRGNVVGGGSGDCCTFPAIPIVRVRSDGHEVANILFRSYRAGQGGGGFVWERGFLGEMALDSATNVGCGALQAGDLSYVQFTRNKATGAVIGDSYQWITDEMGRWSWLGDSPFVSAWYGTESARVTDVPTGGAYASNHGTDHTNPIRATMHPVFVADIVAVADYRPGAHWTTGTLGLFAENGARSWAKQNGGGYWGYWGVNEWPSTAIGPRSQYAFMSGSRLFLVRGAGDIYCFDCNFSTPSTGVTISGPTTADPTVAQGLYQVKLNPFPSVPTGAVTVTMSDGGAGGTFLQPDGVTVLSGNTLSLDARSQVAYFDYKPAIGAAGTTVTLTATAVGI